MENPVIFPEMTERFPGMTLRDYFAAAVVSSIPGTWIPNGNKAEMAASLAEAVYMIADAMLKEREK